MAKITKLYTIREIKKAIYNKKYPFKYNNLIANCEEDAYNILYAYTKTGIENYSRKKFYEFVKEQGCTTWHILDGWVSVIDMKRKKFIFDEDEIKLIWIDGHSGYSHHNIEPKIGEKIAFVENSPDIDWWKNEGTFKVYIYEEYEDKYETKLNYYHYLKKIKEIKVRFNGLLCRYEEIFDGENYFSILKKLLSTHR